MPLTNRSRKVGVIKAENEIKTKVTPPRVTTMKHGSLSKTLKLWSPIQRHRSYWKGKSNVPLVWNFFTSLFSCVLSTDAITKFSILPWWPKADDYPWDRVVKIFRSCKTRHCISQKTEGGQPKQRETPCSFSYTTQYLILTAHPVRAERLKLRVLSKGSCQSVQIYDFLD